MNPRMEQRLVRPELIAEQNLITSPLPYSWEATLIRLREQLAQLVIRCNLFDQNDIAAFRQSRQPNGTYLIDAGDSILINNVKCLINLLYTLELMKSALLEPLSEYMKSDGWLEGSVHYMTFLANYARKRNSLIKEFKFYLRNLNYYLDSLKNSWGAMSGVRNDLKKLLILLGGQTGVQLEPLINQVGYLLSRPREEHEGQAVKQPEQSAPVIKIAAVVDDVKARIDTLLVSKQNKLAADRDGLYAEDSTEDPALQNLVHAANTLTRFKSAMLKVDRTVNHHELHFLDVFRDLGNTLKELQQINLESIKRLSAMNLRDLIKMILEGIAPLFPDMARLIEFADSRLGMTSPDVDRLFTKAYEHYRALAAILDIKLNDRFPFWEERLLIRRQEYARKKQAISELEEAKEFIENTVINETASLRILLSARRAARRIGTPNMYYYEKEINALIAAKTGMNQLAAQISKWETLARTGSGEAQTAALNRLQKLYPLRKEMEKRLETILSQDDNRLEFFSYDALSESIINRSAARAWYGRFWRRSAARIAEPRVHTLKTAGEMLTGLRQECWRLRNKIREAEEHVAAPDASAARDTPQLPLAGSEAAETAPVSNEEILRRLHKTFKGQIVIKSETARAQIEKYTLRFLDPGLSQAFASSRQASGLYTVALKDPVVVKNIKLLLNCMNRMEEVLIRIQPHLRNIAAGKGHVPCAVYGWPSAHEAFLALQLDLKDLIFYLDQLNRAAPHLAGIPLSPLAGKLLSLAMPVWNSIRNQLVMPDVSVMLPENLMQHVNHLLVNLNALAKADSASDYDMVFSPLHGALGALDEFIQSRYDIQRGKSGSFKISDARDDRDIKDILTIANTLNTTTKTLRGLVSVADETALKNIFRVVANSYSIYRKAKQLYRSRIHEIKTAVKDLMLAIHPLLMRVTVNISLVEMKAGLPQGMLENRLARLCREFENAADSLCLTFSGYYPFAMEKIQMLETEAVIETGVKDRLTELQAILRAHTEAETCSLNVATFTLCGLTALRDRLRLLPPSSVHTLLREIDLAIARRTGLSTLENEIRTGRNELARLDLALAKMESKKLATHEASAVLEAQMTDTRTCITQVLQQLQQQETLAAELSRRIDEVNRPDTDVKEFKYENGSINNNVWQPYTAGPMQYDSRLPLSLAEHIQHHVMVCADIAEAKSSLICQHKSFITSMLINHQANLKKTEQMIGLAPGTLTSLIPEDISDLQKATRVAYELNHAHGVLSEFLSHHHGKIPDNYAAILETPSSSSTLAKEMAREAAKHSSTIGRFFRRILGKPTVGDNMYEVANHAYEFKPNKI